MKICPEWGITYASKAQMRFRIQEKPRESIAMACKEAGRQASRVKSKVFFFFHSGC